MTGRAASSRLVGGEPRNGHRSDGELRGWRDLRAGMTKRPRDRATPREGGDGVKGDAEIGSNGFDEGERGSLTLVIALVVGGKLGE